jgi:hypothetical protein
MPLRLARYGVPLAETAPSGLAAAGIEPALLPPAPRQELQPQQALASAETTQVPAASAAPGEQRPVQPPSANAEHEASEPESDQSPWFQPPPQEIAYQGGYDPMYDPQEQYEQWYQEQLQAEQYQGQYQQEPPSQEPSPEETGSFPIPVAPGRTRELGEGGGPPEPDEEAYYQIFRQSIDGSYPTPRVLGDNIQATYGVTLSPSALKALTETFQHRHGLEMEEDHIA